MLAGDCTKATSVLFLVPEAPKILGGSWFFKPGFHSQRKHILMGESPKQSRKLVVCEQI